MSLLLRNERNDSLPFGADGRCRTNRLPFEFHPTPPEATRALLSVETFTGSIWEPACGDGALADVLAQEAGYDVVSTDLVDYGYGVAGIDFLKETETRATNIVTNHPYGSGLADTFATKALELVGQTGGKVAFLLNLASLCHPLRTPWFHRFTPARIWAVAVTLAEPHEHHARLFAAAPELLKAAIIAADLCKLITKWADADQWDAYEIMDEIVALAQDEQCPAKAVAMAPAPTDQ